MDTFNLRQFVQEPTHNRGGLDVVIASDDTESHDLVVAKTGLSDPRLVNWLILAAAA